MPNLLLRNRHLVLEGFVESLDLTVWRVLNHIYVLPNHTSNGVLETVATIGIESYALGFQRLVGFSVGWQLYLEEDKVDSAGRYEPIDCLGCFGTDGGETVDDQVILAERFHDRISIKLEEPVELVSHSW